MQTRSRSRVMLHSRQDGIRMLSTTIAELLVRCFVHFLAVALVSCPRFLLSLCCAYPVLLGASRDTCGFSACCRNTTLEGGADVNEMTASRPWQDVDAHHDMQICVRQNRRFGQIALQPIWPRSGSSLPSPTVNRPQRYSPTPRNRRLSSVSPDANYPLGPLHQPSLRCVLYSLSNPKTRRHCNCKRRCSSLKRICGTWRVHASGETGVWHVLRWISACR